MLKTENIFKYADEVEPLVKLQDSDVEAWGSLVGTLHEALDERTDKLINETNDTNFRILQGEVRILTKLARELKYPQAVLSRLQKAEATNKEYKRKEDL